MAGGICVIRFCSSVWLACEGDIIGKAGMLELSGNNWSGWKFSHVDCEMFGEFLVTRYRSGGVGGTEKEGLKGVAGRVCGLELVPPMNVSPVTFARVFGD